VWIVGLGTANEEKSSLNEQSNDHESADMDAGIQLFLFVTCVCNLVRLSHCVDVCCCCRTVLADSDEEPEPKVLTPVMEKWLVEVAHPQLAHLGRNQFAKGKVWAQLTIEFNKLHGVEYERHFLQAQLRLLNSKNAGSVCLRVSTCGLWVGKCVHAEA
jgi:hypothetical protein